MASLECDADLSYFDLIVPAELRETVTRCRKNWTELDMGAVRSVSRNFGGVFEPVLWSKGYALLGNVVAP